MSRHLTGTVHVRDDEGVDHMFGPADDVPEWAAGQIGDHAWDGPAEEPEEKAPAGNASEATWKAYAVKRGVQEAELQGLSRDQVKEKVAALDSPPAE